METDSRGRALYYWVTAADMERYLNDRAGLKPVTNIELDPDAGSVLTMTPAGAGPASSPRGTARCGHPRHRLRPATRRRRRIEDVVGLTWDDVRVTDDLVAARVGAIEIALPEPPDEPWRELAANPGYDLTAAHPNSNWVFREYSPDAISTPGPSERGSVTCSAPALHGWERSTN